MVKLDHIQTPTEIDHYQIQRVTDVYVTPPERTWAASRDGIQKIIADDEIPGKRPRRLCAAWCKA